MPTGSDVALIISTGETTVSKWDIVIYKSAASHSDGKSLMKINVTHPMYDPLMYVLIFPFGDKGWKCNYMSGNKKCTPLQYYKYRLMVHDNSFNTIHCMGRLFQQYIVAMYAKIEEEQLKYLRNNQSTL